jgi:hypothetical protein
MKKFVLLAAVAAFAATVIGCGPTPTTGGGTKATVASTETKTTTK